MPLQRKPPANRPLGTLPAQHLGIDLAGERQDGSAIDLGVPHPGQEIRRARTGDGQASRGPAGELAVGRGGKGGGALVANGDVLEIASLVLPSDGVCEPEVRVPTMPNTWVTPQLTMVSAIASVTVRVCRGSSSSAT